MASTNQSPQYMKAEAKFLAAKTNEEKLRALEEMIKECPKHKSAEKMLAQLKTRYKKLKERTEKDKKTGKAKKAGIKKEDMQAVLIGFTNTGKTSLLSSLTNIKAEIANYDFTTKSPIIGTLHHQGVNIQIIDIPAFESEYYDKGIVNSADTILILIENIENIKKIEKDLENARGKKIIVFNKIDLLSSEEKRKIFANLQSKRYNFVMISTKTNEGIEELKNKIFESFDKIRIYLKEPRKEIDKKKDKPLILDINSTIKDAAEKILKGFSSKIKKIRIWGPSSKFPGQNVGLKHKLRDLDIIEFKTK